MKAHLVDGTFELFRCFHGTARATGPTGREVGAARGLFATMVSLLSEPDVSHVAVAFDSVVVPAGADKDPSANGLIGRQQALAAQVVRALGVPVWPAGRFTADELIASATALLDGHRLVDQVVICSTDNDFNQCVRGDRVVVLDRVRKVVTDERTVRARYGVAPQQLPDLFALVGDRSDGIPGVPGWGVQSAAGLLQHYGRLADIPLDAERWPVLVRGRDRLAASLRAHHAEALLCRELSELRRDLPVPAHPAVLEWRGAHRDRVTELVKVLDDDSVVERIPPVVRAVTTFEPWTVVARNLPEHAGNAIHTDEGARRAGFPNTLVAGVTTYGYLTHPVVASWGRSWLAGGGAEVRFRSPVFDGDEVTCQPVPRDLAVGVTAIVDDGPPRAELEAWASTTEVPPEPTGDQLPTLALRLEGLYSSAYGSRAGDDLPLYQRLGVVHPAVWPALANQVVHRHVAIGAWIHTRSRIAHLGLGHEGGLAQVRAAVVARTERKQRTYAVLDVRIDVDGRPAAWLEHEAIVRLPADP